MKLKIKKIVGFYPNDKKTGLPNKDDYGTYTVVWLFIEGQDGLFTGKAREGSPMLSFKEGDEVDLVITGEKQVGDKKYVNFRLGGEVKPAGNAQTPQKVVETKKPEAFNAETAFRQLSAEVQEIRKRLDDIENEGGIERPEDVPF